MRFLFFLIVLILFSCHNNIVNQEKIFTNIKVLDIDDRRNDITASLQYNGSTLIFNQNKDDKFIDSLYKIKSDSADAFVSFYDSVYVETFSDKNGNLNYRVGKTEIISIAQIVMLIVIAIIIILGSLYMSKNTMHGY